MLIPLLVIAFVILWCVCGFQGFVFWWTHDYDLTSPYIVVGLVASILGPLAWGVGWIIHGDSTDKPKVDSPPKVWVNKRVNKR